MTGTCKEKQTHGVLALAWVQSSVWCAANSFSTCILHRKTISLYGHILRGWEWMLTKNQTFARRTSQSSQYEFFHQIEQPRDNVWRLCIIIRCVSHCLDIHAACSKASSALPIFFLHRSICFLNWAIASRGVLCWKHRRQIYREQKRETWEEDLATCYIWDFFIYFFFIGTHHSEFTLQ